jgi:hypothetical protein
MLSLLWPLVLIVIANPLYDDIVPPTIQIILLAACAISFCVAYFDQLFLEGDSESDPPGIGERIDLHAVRFKGRP